MVRDGQVADPVKNVIIGNGAAGVNAIKAIRESGSSCDIVMVTAENCNAYSPVLITHYLSGEILLEEVFVVDSQFYKKNCVQVAFGDKAIGLDPSKQIVYLESGKKILYDNLLIATGATPRCLLAKSPEVNQVLSVWTLQDAKNVLQLAKTGKEIIIIGGGLIGLRVADALSRYGVHLTILESMGHILYRNVDADCAQIIQREMECRGLSIICGVNVIGIEAKLDKAIVVLDVGKEFTADFVIINIGVEANIGWLDGSGIMVNQGILVDEFLRATCGNVFAAGDVTEIKNVVTGQTDVLPGWGAACIQGRVAGSNMVGQLRTYQGGIMENTTSLFGLPIATIGLIRCTDGVNTIEILVSDYQRRIYRKILISNNRLIGAILLGIAEDMGVIRYLIMNQVDVSKWQDEISQNPMEIRNLVLSRVIRTWSMF